MMRHLAIALAALWLALTPAAADPFGTPSAAPAVEAAAPPASFGASWGGTLLRRLAHAQMGLNRTVASEFRQVRETGSAAAIAAILALAFAWGVLHAAGPGHGKSVVASYFVAHGARWTSGIVMGGLISLLQGLTAIGAVLVLSRILHLKQLEVENKGALIQVVSYALVTGLGAAMFWRAATGRACHHGHAHGDGQCGREHGSGLRRMLVAAAGIAPCGSAVIIMLFALGNQAMGLGIAAVLALSLGMAATLSAIGVLSILGRRSLMRLTEHGHGLAERVGQALALLGAGAVVGFSLLLMLGAWSQL
jgi:ABC-type nickel/cobalt efflux system permease component RcnA